MLCYAAEAVFLLQRFDRLPKVVVNDLVYKDFTEAVDSRMVINSSTTRIHKAVFVRWPSAAWWVQLVVYVLLLFAPGVNASFQFPSVEFEALYGLYNATKGEYWQWYSPYSNYGYPWDFSSSVNPNPCDQSNPWQGVTCTSNCKQSQCYTLKLELYSLQLHGIIPSSIGNLTQLEYLDLYGNMLTGSIPSSIGNLTQLYDLYLEHNMLTGRIPSNIGKLTQLEYLSLEYNMLTGSIPSNIGNLTQLEYLYLYNNMLTGIIPCAVGLLSRLKQLQLSFNLLTGSIPMLPININVLIVNDNYVHGSFPTAMFCNCSLIAQIYISNNLFSGSLPQVLPSNVSFSNGCWSVLKILQISSNMFTGSLPIGYVQKQLEVFYLNDNSFTGSIPSDWFDQATRLQDLCLAQNCLSGSIPDSICSSKSLQRVSLDGLHAATTCVHKIIPWYDDSGLYAASQVGGSVPSCLLQLANLTQLQLSGNAFVGTLPSKLANSLSILILANNRFSGSIPRSLWNSSKLTYLDVSFNRFKDSFPVSPFLLLQQQNVSSGVSYYLQNNRLSGRLPSDLRFAENVNILEGNQFQCNIDRNDLPQHDPQQRSYDCGSDATNTSLIVWISMLVGVMGLVFIWNLVSYSRISESIASFEQRKKVLLDWWQSYCEVVTFEESAKGLFLEFKKFHSLLLTVSKICFTLIIIATMLLLPSYVTVSAYYSTHDYSYIWIVSSCYLRGTIPTIVLCVLYVFILSCLSTMLWAYVWSGFKKLNVNIVEDQATRINAYKNEVDSNIFASTLFKVNVFVEEQCIDDENSKQSVHKAEDVKSKQHHPLLHRLWVVGQYAVFIILNMVIVSTVSATYVYIVVVGKYDVNIIFLSSLLLSVFKLLWNSLTLGGLLYQLVTTRVFADVHLTGFHFVLLSLVNNIFIPYIAQAFVSPACFQYAVQLPSPVTIYQLQYECYFDPQGGSYCFSISTTFTSYYPSFHYTYQCSSSLIVAFINVFVYRYLIASVVLPVMYLAIYYFCTNSIDSSRRRRWLWKLLPPLWKLHTKLTTIEEYHFHTFRRSMESTAVVNNLSIELVTGFAMMLTFGMAFPPLIVLIAVSSLSQILIFCLLIGRWKHFIKTLTTTTTTAAVVTTTEEKECNGHLQIASALTKLLVHVATNQFQDVEKIFSQGMLVSVGIAALFQSFVLFDTLGDEIGDMHAYWIVIVMILPIISLLSLLILYSRLRVIRKQQQQMERERGESTNRLDMIVQNPLRTVIASDVNSNTTPAITATALSAEEAL